MITRTVSQLAEICGATLEGDGARRIVGPAALAEARDDQVSFLGNPRYTAELASTRAAAVLVSPGVEARRAGLSLLRCENPSQAFTRVIEEFVPESRTPEPGIHATAIVAPDAHLADGVSVGPHCVIGAEATIGERVVLEAAVVVGAGARIGADSLLHASCVLYDGVALGERCVVHAGAVIGSDGFGFEPTAEGWDKIPQCGTVVVEDDVEIGANTTIDRGRFGATRIGRGAKIDNLVHVAHNVVIGEGALLIAQVGIAGSSTIGKRAILAGQVGVTGHVRVGDGARISAQSGISKDITGGSDYFGSPVRPQMDAMRILAVTGKLPEMARRLRELERRVAELSAARPTEEEGPE